MWNNNCTQHRLNGFPSTPFPSSNGLGRRRLKIAFRRQTLRPNGLRIRSFRGRLKRHKVYGVRAFRPVLFLHPVAGATRRILRLRHRSDRLSRVFDTCSKRFASTRPNVPTPKNTCIQSNCVCVCVPVRSLLTFRILVVMSYR